MGSETRATHRQMHNDQPCTAGICIRMPACRQGTMPCRELKMHASPSVLTPNAAGSCKPPPGLAYPLEGCHAKAGSNTNANSLIRRLGIAAGTKETKSCWPKIYPTGFLDMLLVHRSVCVHVCLSIRVHTTVGHMSMPALAQVRMRVWGRNPSHLPVRSARVTENGSLAA